MKPLHSLEPIEHRPGVTILDDAFPHVEVFGVRNISETNDETRVEQIWPTSSEPPDFWTVYAHPEGDDAFMCLCLSDHDTRDEALDAAADAAQARGYTEFYDFTKEGYFE